MAFTEQNKADAYLFFVLAFNAAPGTVYGGQIVEAYESGMTTAEIVAQYTSKDAFKAIYADSQTSAQFAASLVSNVASLTTSATAKTAAEADIVSALAAGWSKAQVITQILGNLANKTVADADWGKTVAQLNNKIAVAKALTEGDKALNTTDVATLQGPLASVTEVVGTVQDAINGAGPLATKIDALNAAHKAQDAFYKLDSKLDTTAKIKAKVVEAVNAVEDVSVNGKGLKDESFSDVKPVEGYDVETVSAATQAAIIAAAKQKNADAVTTAKTALDAEKAKFLTANATVSKAKLDTYVSAKIAVDAAEKAVGVGTINTTAPTNTGTVKVVNEAKDALTAAVAVAAPNDFDATGASVEPATGTVKTAANLDIITVQSGKLALDATFVAKASAAQLTAAQKLLDGIVANQTAVAAKASADAALVAATNALGGADKAAVDTALKTFAATETAVVDLDKTLKSYNDAIALLNKDTQLAKAIKAAEKAFEDAGQVVPKAIVAGSLTTSGEDVFLVSADSNKQALSGFAAGDKIYAGKDYTVSADITKGDDAKLEVFFKTNGANTDVYIEQKAFGSNTTAAADGNADFIKITLTGVAADKLVLKDGFVTVAA